MKGLLDSIAAQSGAVILVLGIVILALSAVLVRLSARVQQMQARWREILAGTQTGNLELLLQDHLRERLRLQGEVEAAHQRIQALERKMATSKRHLGLVRYDAFEDVGGSQSFALAIYDDEGNGAVMNGLIGRTDTRVYCKPLVAGRSDRMLSQEETLAVEQAVSPAPKAVVSP